MSIADCNSPLNNSDKRTQRLEKDLFFSASVAA